MQAGSNPRTTALGIVGRMNRATGRREGGIIGLTQRQARFVESAKAELQDPAKIEAYLTRKLRDKRFDRIVARARREGKPVSAADIQRIAARYSDRLLKHRGDVIARTETMQALHAAQYEAMQQLAATGKVSPDAIRMSWQATGDARTRDSHRAMHGEAIGLNGSFVTPSGARMRYPGDTGLGAGPEEIINCRCYLQPRIDFLANVR